MIQTILEDLNDLKFHVEICQQCQDALKIPWSVDRPLCQIGQDLALDADGGDCDMIPGEPDPLDALRREPA